MGAIPWILHIQCTHCGRAVPCADCTKQDISHAAALQCNRSSVVLNAMMKTWLSEYKYKGNDPYGAILGAMLLPAFYAVCLQNIHRNGELAEWRRSGRKLEHHLKKGRIWDIVTSVPISKQRGLERGFNQAEQLALRLCSKFDLPYMPLIQRIEQSGHMSHKNKQERGQFVATLYQPLSYPYYERLLDRLPEQTKVIRVLLVDDVYTTGNTVRACAAIIQAALKQGVQIYSLTWARS